jgi:transposase
VRLFTEEEVQRIVTAAVASAIAPLKARIAELEAEVAGLKKDSSTSSKPPSSDIVKPPRWAPRKGPRGKRSAGGQRGHPRHMRILFPPARVDKIWLYEWEATPAGWKPLEQFRVMQQVELREQPCQVTEHRARLYENRRTGQVRAVPLPAEVRRAGLLGPRLSALVAYQKGACHMSVETVRRFLADVLQVPISQGQVVKTVHKAGRALAASYAQLERALPDQPYLGIDETGHPERGRGLWSWCFHVPGAQGFTWFHIAASRGAQVLNRFLGATFQGIVSCDYSAAYRKFLRETAVGLQLCWAHLIRDVKYLTALADRATRGYGQRLLETIKALFRLWHHRETLPPTRWDAAAARARRDVLAVARRVPRRTEALNIAQRFQDHADAYFTFLDHPGIEPTNNGTERQIRFLAIDRKITQGTRGEAGRRWCERIWTVLATCALQGRSAFDFLYASIAAPFRDHPSPSLLTGPP